jgi:hypothetical protein
MGVQTVLGEYSHSPAGETEQREEKMREKKAKKKKKNKSRDRSRDEKSKSRETSVAKEQVCDDCNS